MLGRIFFNGFPIRAGQDWNVQKERLEKGNNPDFWINKIERNIQRDGCVSCCLESEGWSVFRFWGEDIKKRTDYCVGIIMDAIKAKSDDKNLNIDNVVSYGADSSVRKIIYVVAAVIIKADDNGVKRVFTAQRGYGKFKDLWEFPGGKEELGESPEEALVREIREELDTEIDVGEFIDIIEYDYPDFHLSMECYQCSVVSGKLTLLEHENAKWLSVDELDSVEWLPADISILDKIGALLK